MEVPRAIAFTGSDDGAASRSDSRTQQNNSQITDQGDHDDD